MLLDHGESLQSLGPNALTEAAFHGHWQLCQFLIEQGADANAALPDTGETPLHAALCTADRSRHDLVVKVLLANGADPNRATRPGVETGAFMRDCRTKGETPLHRAAAFGTEETVQLLLDSGARVEVKDVNGDSPLGWASWYARPDSILRKLLYGNFSIHPERKPMKASLLGLPCALIAMLLSTACTTTQPVYFTPPERATLGLPYSDSVRVGNLLFLSGAIGSTPGSRELVPGGVVAETRQVLENIKRNLEASGSSLDRVVKCTVMLADIADFERMNSVYREYFPTNRPARSTFGVSGLARGARVEIECIAVAKGDLR
jgi:reactive intermediate/imine deaminase